MRFLRNFKERGTLLFVSHDIGAVLNMCERAIMLDKGQIDCEGDAKSVTAKYLATLYEFQQGESWTLKNERDLTEAPETEVKDMRLNFLNTTRFRNDIELFAFQPDSPSFGKGGATITSVMITDKEGIPLSWLVGGENVYLIIKCQANTDLYSPIVGFFIKDRLGQTVFGDNTFITYQSDPVTVLSGQFLQAEFKFRMPLLPVGDYSVCAAIADGTQENHVQHHWIHDAVFFKSITSSVATGLVGIPMLDVKLKAL